MRQEETKVTRKEPIKTFPELVTRLQSQDAKVNVAVVGGRDEATVDAVEKATEMGFIHPLWMDMEDPKEASAKAIEAVRKGLADVVMKGLVNSDVLLHAILHKETGILPKGKVLTHITAGQIPSYHKLLFFTDAAVIPYPTQEQRIVQTMYMADICHAFGIVEPKMALIHCTEKVNGKLFPFTTGYHDIIDMAERGLFGKCLVDGPFDIKVACNPATMKVKGIHSSIGGDADALIFPDIESANLFHKSLTLFCGATMASILQGPLAPVAMPSRGDNGKSKFYSLAMACASYLHL
ncbi:MAG: phosphate butyryltransferase [Prevotella sp.]|jgi:phosphate butyryltransferase|nr:phosphate butyryltransferase [Prevotella sp.]MCI2102973.1 phosphate butyryltransferase [Prevotella sp.]